MFKIAQKAKSAAKILIPRSIKNTSIYRKLRGLLEAHDTIYDEAYYDRDVEGPAAQAAPHIARSIIARFSPKSLIDVGCGTGVMLAAFRDHGVDVSGLEYSAAGLRRCNERGLNVQKFDLERDVSSATTKTYDVALTLEVAEHLPEYVADRFVGLLCAFSSTVVFSAARPGQGGVDHVNLQPQSYWIEKFAQRGHFHDRPSTQWLAAEWHAEHVAGYYHENLMVFQESNS